MLALESTRHAGSGLTPSSIVVQNEINGQSTAVPSGDDDSGTGKLYDDDDGTGKLYEGSVEPMITAPLSKIADLEVSLKPRGCWKLILC